MNKKKIEKIVTNKTNKMLDERGISDAIINFHYIDDDSEVIHDENSFYTKIMVKDPPWWKFWTTEPEIVDVELIPVKSKENA